jgi:hypothetical protein
MDIQHNPNNGFKIEWTKDQSRAIQARANARILVDAGPGTGKTATACARVAWLIENEGVEPSQILMTSFTNAAVHEILNRIGTYLQQPDRALGIRISTLDSFSWSLRVGFRRGEMDLKGFVENIQEAAELLSVDESAREYLQSIEHFLVDEAQDVTGPRAELILSIISNLKQECGISIFSDEAQAIYGFSEDDTPEYFGNTLPEEIRASEDLAKRFEQIDLKEVHRTNDEKLKTLFFEGRRKLLDVDDIAIDKIYEDVRNLVIDSHHEKVGSAFEILVEEEKAKDLKANDFLLFRRRSDALQGGHYMGTTPFRLRLSGFPVTIHPWIARCFWDYTEDRISESDFADLYKKRTGVKDVEEIESRWRELLREVGVDAHRISVRKLSNLLSRPNVPRCFASPDYGVSGPILGTIHASKGRETDNVWLFVPNSPHFRKIEEEKRFEEVLEEARILFVGATRARNTLVVSDVKAGNHFRRSGNMNESKRAFTIKNASQRKCALELGRKGDVRAEGLVGKRFFGDETEVMLAQKALWTRREHSTPLKASSIRELDYVYQVSIDYQYADSRYEDAFKDKVFIDKLFALDQAVNGDMFRAGKMMGENLKPPSKFRHFYSLGARTLALSTDDPTREVLLEPWKHSGFMLAPILVGYPDIYLNKYARG